MSILEGKRAIVTGASSGVGYGAALRFAQEGANVIAAARRLEKLNELKDDAESRGFKGKIFPVQCDILNEDDLSALVQTAADTMGGIDILACIAQAGLNDQRFTMETDPDNARVFFNGGPIYTMLLIQKCMPYFQEQNYGRIITCASGAGVSATPGFTGYSMAKAGIVALTRLCAKEFAKYGVVTNCFLPVIKAAGFDTSDQGRQAMEMLKQMIPVGYVGDAYEDGSPILAFLASEGAKYINGQFVCIDGGLNLIV
ncbi:MAG: SDR family oxidoreductase [Eubacteriaceae bacterium]|jgi:NAD(P)-dependent dehydrogenase (short-subunit alcohol dehydrogenase family)|nr:SDR family oxidoreductase [Eubacteriaceae bacterium]